MRVSNDRTLAVSRYAAHRNIGPCLDARQMAKKNKPEIKLGEGRVVHLWEEKSVLMVRVASGDLVYNVPASVLVDETKSK